MKAALVVNRVSDCRERNLQQIVQYVRDAAKKGADLVLFPETALTGLVNIDELDHDLPYGVAIPGEVTDTLCEVAKEHSIYVGIGLLEREEDVLYDSAILINWAGGIDLRYRRMSRGWHGTKANSYCKEGTVLTSVQTDFGKVAFLICGDLYDDSLVQLVQKECVDYLLFPFARAFDDGTSEQKRWDEEEMPGYVARVRLAAITTFGTNYVDHEYFGGAFVISGNGEVQASWPLGKRGCC